MLGSMTVVQRRKTLRNSERFVDHWVHQMQGDSKSQVINLIKIVILFQLGIVGATIIGCFLPGAKPCDADVKQHIANMMTVITTSTFALYAAEK